MTILCSCPLHIPPEGVEGPCCHYAVDNGADDTPLVGSGSADGTDCHMGATRLMRPFRILGSSWDSNSDHGVVVPPKDWHRIRCCFGKSGKTVGTSLSVPVEP